MGIQLLPIYRWGQLRLVTCTSPHGWSVGKPDLEAGLLPCVPVLVLPCDFMMRCFWRGWTWQAWVASLLSHCLLLLPMEARGRRHWFDRWWLLLLKGSAKVHRSLQSSSESSLLKQQTFWWARVSETHFMGLLSSFPLRFPPCAWGRLLGSNPFNWTHLTYWASVCSFVILKCSIIRNLMCMKVTQRSY